MIATDMPERIWAKTHGASTAVISGQRGLIGGWNEHRRDGQRLFIRADACLHGEALDEVKRKLASVEVALEFIAAGDSEEAAMADRLLTIARAALARCHGDAK